MLLTVTATKELNKRLRTSGEISEKRSYCLRTAKLLSGISVTLEELKSQLVKDTKQNH
jgi:hypothetical protein